MAAVYFHSRKHWILNICNQKQEETSILSDSQQIWSVYQQAHMYQDNSLNRHVEDSYHHSANLTAIWHQILLRTNQIGDPVALLVGIGLCDSHVAGSSPG